MDLVESRIETGDLYIQKHTCNLRQVVAAHIRHEVSETKHTPGIVVSKALVMVQDVVISASSSDTRNSTSHPE
jgi:hypothetical protein